MKCEYCDMEISVGSRCCKYCGATVGTTEIMKIKDNKDNYTGVKPEKKNAALQTIGVILAFVSFLSGNLLLVIIGITFGIMAVDYQDRLLHLIFSFGYIVTIISALAVGYGLLVLIARTEETFDACLDVGLPCIIIGTCAWIFCVVTTFISERIHEEVDHA